MVVVSNGRIKLKGNNNFEESKSPTIRKYTENKNVITNEA